MTRTYTLALILGAFLLTGTPFARSALAAPIPACTAADIIAADNSCPATGLCTITKIFDIADGCVFDFGTRDVHVANSGELRIDGSMVTFLTGDFIVLPGALIDGRTVDIGGFFTVRATGDIEIQKATPVGKLYTNGDMRGGNVVLEATGNIEIQGDLKSNSSGAGSGGSISLRAGGNVVTTSTADIDVHGGLQGCGGEIDFIAGGSVDIGKTIDVTGGDGGTVNIAAGSLAIVRDTLVTTGQGDAGSGGCIDIVGDSVELNGAIQSKGTGSSIDSGGGCGGAIFIAAEFGDAVVRDIVDATSGSPDGGGGCVEFFVQGDIDIQGTAQVLSEGTGGQSCGGEVILDARGEVLVNGPISATGGDSGGCVEIDAGRSIAINQSIRVDGGTPGSFGGSITIEGAVARPAPVLVNALLDASGASCDEFGFCSLGGDVDVAGCDVTLSPLGRIQAQAGGSGGSGGSVFLVGRGQVTVSGPIDATGGSTALNGSVSVIRPTVIPPVVTGSVMPALIDTPRALCTGGGGDPPFCLTPCPACGDGATNFPETCDDTTGTPASCDGCSANCRLEDCDDQNPCTVDTCDPDLGCRHTSVVNGTTCADSTVCNGIEMCMNGTCRAGTPLTCNDGNDCTLDTCNPATGCQTANVAAGTACQNGNQCTENDTCNGSGTCLPGSALDCDDGEECTADSCNPAVGCLHDGVSPSFTPCTADSDPCTVDICFSGACAHGNFPPPFTSDGAACDDGNPCSVSDTCLGGVCQPGSPVVCTPLDDCHDAGVCTPGAGCSNPAKMDGAACDDGNLCTLTDTCQGGACTGANLVVCTALDQCHDPGTCNPGTGSCSTPNKTDGSGCDDGNLCTLTDTCQNGICTGADLLTCGDGTVQPECGEECDDGSTGDGDGCSAVCLVEPCSVCTSEPSVCVPDAGAPCDDGNVCTNDDACDAGGVCVGETKPRTGCARPVQPGGALLKIKESANPKSDQVLFKWTKGAATTKTDFGDPAFGNTDYSICVYDEVGDVPTLIFEATAPARSFCSGNFCWKGGNTGFKYRDSAGSRAGLQQIQLKAGPAGKAKVQGKAKGINLTLPSLGLAQDAVVSAQIVGSNGVCFEGQFLPPANVNRSDQFKDKGE